MSLLRVWHPRVDSQGLHFALVSQCWLSLWLRLRRCTCCGSEHGWAIQVAQWKQHHKRFLTLDKMYLTDDRPTDLIKITGICSFHVWRRCKPTTLLKKKKFSDTQRSKPAYVRWCRKYADVKLELQHRFGLKCSYCLTNRGHALFSYIGRLKVPPEERECDLCKSRILERSA